MMEGAMLTVGVDAHKGTNMAVALDAAGREVARWRGPNNAAGRQQGAGWAATLGPEVQWGIEGAWNYGRGLAQCLVEAGATVFEVNARWTAAGRRRARRPGKRDGLDARAVALVVCREAGPPARWRWGLAAGGPRPRRWRPTTRRAWWGCWSPSATGSSRRRRGCATN